MSYYTDLNNNIQNIYTIDILKRYYIVEVDYYLSTCFKDKILNSFINSIELTEEEDIYFNYLQIENLKDYISFEVEKKPLKMKINFIFYFNKEGKRMNFVSKELDQCGGLDNFINKRKLQQKLKEF